MSPPLTRLLICISFTFPSLATLAQNADTLKEPPTIQMVLLLDVSGSMNGLLNQAKSQIWNMAHELSKAEKKGQPARIELALGSYGGYLYRENNFCHLHTPLTSDIDLVADYLFEFETRGGEEYCGYAIQFALDSLQWSPNKKDLKVIFIAGNEPFDQGPSSYITACKLAEQQDILVNTIYCGSEDMGKIELWEEGAQLGKGKYLTIQQDSSAQLYETFWDTRLIEYNDNLNQTYVPYGPEGELSFQRLLRQDKYMLLLGKVFVRDRIFFKLDQVNNNQKWDLVDAFQQDPGILGRLAPEDFPEQMRSMSLQQKQGFLQEKATFRELYLEGAEICYNKAQEALQRMTGEAGANISLKQSILETVREQGEKRGFVFRN